MTNKPSFKTSPALSNAPAIAGTIQIIGIGIMAKIANKNKHTSLSFLVYFDVMKFNLCLVKLSIQSKYFIEVSLKLLINFLLIRNLAMPFGSQIRLLVMSICVAMNTDGKANIVEKPIGKGIGNDTIKNAKKDKI